PKRPVSDTSIARYIPRRRHKPSGLDQDGHGHRPMRLFSEPRRSWRPIADSEQGLRTLVGTKQFFRAGRAGIGQYISYPVKWKSLSGRRHAIHAWLTGFNEFRRELVRRYVPT